MKVLRSVVTIAALLRSSAASIEDGDGCCSGDMSRDSVEGSKDVESCGSDQLTRGGAAPGGERVLMAKGDRVPDVKAVLIEPAEFRMGTDRPRIPMDGEGPSRRVELTRAFLMDARARRQFLADMPRWL